MLEITKS